MWTIESRMADKEFVASLPKSRAEAKAIGSKIYYNGLCRRGHDSYKTTGSGCCCKCRSIIAVRGLEKIDPEAFVRQRKLANDRWNASNKGKNAKTRWAERDPKWAWVVSAVGGARDRIKKGDKIVAFDITNDYIRSILPDICPVFGTPFMYRGRKKTHPESPSIDRIDPKLGYVVGNVAIISHRANSIKSNASAEEIQKVADWLKLQEIKL
jgi:hypothetical protein